MNDPTGMLFDSAALQPALEKFAAVTHLTVSVYDTEARVVCGPLYSTPLFALFEEYGYDPGIFGDCARLCLAQTTERPALVPSSYGLAVVGTSLVLEGVIAGAAVAGYALTDFVQSVAIERLARQSGIPFRRLWEIARQQQPVPPRRLLLDGELLQVLGDAILRENHRTRQYEEAAARLTSASASKDEFLTMVSHELRTPMTSILGWVQLLDHGSLDPDLMPAALENIDRAVHAQARIIDDMTDVSRMLVDKLSIDYETVDVKAIVDASIAGMAPVAALRGISIERSGESVTIDADAQRLRQVFLNLLSNAIKFSFPDSRVRVVVEGGQNRVCISVIDEGRGIGPEFLPRVFERFSQQHSSEFGGFGLGLAIAQYIVERHGGSIEVESEGEGKGATFRVSLPLLRPELVPARPAHI